MAQFSTDSIRRQNPLPDIVARCAGVRVDANGKGEWSCLCPFHTEKTPSFTIFDGRDGYQRFHCYGCGVCGDVIEFVQAWEQCDFREACERLGGARDWNPAAAREKSAPREVRDPYAGLVFKLPPADAVQLVPGERTPDLFNPKRVEDGRPFTRYTPTLVHPYRARDGRLIGYVLRVDTDAGKLTPTIVWLQRPDGSAGWSHGAFPTPRPPYRIDDAARRAPDAQVIVVEGEKTADAAARLFPRALVLSWSGGSKAYALTRWDVIAGRNVVLWADNDMQGMEAMLGRPRRQEWIPGLASFFMEQGCAVRLIGGDDELPEGWDLADGERDGWTTADAAAYAKANAVEVDDRLIEAHKRASSGGSADPLPQVAFEAPKPAPDDTPQQITTEQARPDPEPERNDEPPSELSREEAGNVVAIHGAAIPQGVTVDPHRDWQGRLHKNAEGVIRPKSYHNACVMVRSHPEFRDLFAFDEFACRPLLMREPSWTTNSADSYPAPLNDTIVMKLRARLENKGIVAGIGDVGSAVHIASEDNRVNPMRDWLNSLVWDGVSRLSGADTAPGWLTAYLAAEDTPVNRAFGRRWMIAAVARALSPGCKVDNMLILEGPQGYQKSTALRILGTVGRNTYYTDSIDDIHSKDAVQQMQGKWIIEFAELDAMSRAEADTFKKFQTRQSDLVRLPYTKTPQTFPRTCIFAGTINPIGNGYLKDPTGARRYWPVKVGETDTASLARDRDQLVAEAVAAHLAGEQHWLTPQEDALARAVQERRLMNDPWAAAILDRLNQVDRITIRSLIADTLAIPASQQTSLTSRRVASILKAEQWGRRMMQVDQLDTRVLEFWTKPGSRYDRGDEA